MILIGALPTVYSSLRAAIRGEGQSNIVVAQQISPTITNLVTVAVELRTVGFVSHHLDIFQIDSCICILIYNKDKEKVIIGG